MSGIAGGPVKGRTNINTEPFLELIPNVRPQPVPAHRPDSMFLVQILSRDGIDLGGCKGQVPTRLAHILKYSGIMPPDLAPKVGRRELAPDRRRAALE